MKTFKKTLCLVLVVVMALSLFAVAASAKSLSDYSDASAVGSNYKSAVDFDTQLGVLRGNTSTTYNPQGYLTRAQLATIIYRITTGDVDDTYVKNYANGTTFTDVKSTDWFAGYVNYCADNGLLKGVGADKYAPNSYLTGYQAMAALLRAIGYDANNEFVGKDWTLAVTKAAKDSGINAGIVADWANPISREVTAQLIFNTLFTQKVKYTPLIGYTSLLQGTLAKDVFDIVTGKDGELSLDKFGNPMKIWKNSKGKTVVSIYDTVVKTYTKAVSGCDVLVDVGIPKTDLTTAAVLTFRTLNGTHTMPLTHKNLDCEKIYFGGNGVLTQVYTNGYDSEGRLMVIISETAYYLAKVTAVATNTHGSATGATATVYGPSAYGWENQAIDSSAYPVGSYILVTAPYGESYLNLSNAGGITKVLPTERAANDPAPSGIVWTVAGTPTTFVGKLTSVTSNGIPGGGNVTTFKIDGKDYEFSFKKYYDYITNLAIGGSYTFFLDAYGYIIGVAPYSAPQSYGVIDKMYYQTNGFDAGAGHAKVVYMDASTAEVNIDKIDGYTVVNGDFYQPGSANVSQDVAQNWPYYGVLYNLTSGSIVTQTLLSSNTSIKNGSARIWNHIFTKNTTVFLYKTLDNNGNAVYTSYTGYNAAPSANGAKVWYVDVAATSGDKFVDYVFVDATLNGLADASTGNYIVNNAKWFSATNEGGATVYSYKVYDMAGNEVIIKSEDDDLFDGDEGVFKVSFNKGLAVNASYALDWIGVDEGDKYVGTVFVDQNTPFDDHYDLDGKDIFVVTPAGVTTAKATDAAVATALNDTNTWFEILYVNGVPSAYYIFFGF